MLGWLSEGAVALLFQACELLAVRQRSCPAPSVAGEWSNSTLTDIKPDAFVLAPAATGAAQQAAAALAAAEDLDGIDCNPGLWVLVCLLAALEGVLLPCRQYRDMGHEANVKSAWSTAGNCDMIMFIVDAHRQVSCPLCRLGQLVWARPAVMLAQIESRMRLGGHF